MNLQRHHLFALLTLSCILATATTVLADKPPAADSRTTQPADIRTVLERNKDAAALPAGLIIRVSACLGQAENPGPNDPAVLKESWEITATEIHRVVADSKNGQVFYRRLESRPFDSKGICKELLEGKALEIQARKGNGPEVGLIGTNYRRGSRSIEVTLHDQTLLDLGETNGPFLHFYRESDAKAFGALYERLAGKARELLRAKDEPKR